jgi:anti-anti-sigma regulatory factor
VNLTIEQIQDNNRLAIIGVQGNLDGSNYQELVAKAKELHNQGIEMLLLDLSQTLFMSSAGLVAIHRIAKLLQGEPLPDTDNGWAAIHAVENAAARGRQQCVKLLNPQERVMRTLAVSGLDKYFEIYSERGAALSSF